MKIMVVGGGGREHAIIKKIKENKNVTEIFALPGNGGIAKDATCVDIGAKDIDKIVEFAVNEKIDFAVVAPDDPLVLGAVDKLNEKGIKVVAGCPELEINNIVEKYLNNTLATGENSCGSDPNHSCHGHGHEHHCHH